MVNHLYEADVVMSDGQKITVNVHTSGFPKDIKIAEAELRKIPAYAKARSITIRPAQGPVDMTGHPLAGSLYNSAGEHVSPDHTIDNAPIAPVPQQPAPVQSLPAAAVPAPMPQQPSTLQK